MTRQRPRTMVLGLLIHAGIESNLELPACMAVSCISPPEPSNEVLGVCY